MTGKLVSLEPGSIVIIELTVYGLICNLRDSVYSIGGLLGGLVVSAVLGAALSVYVNDGGGLTCTFVLRRGSAGSKFLCGCSVSVEVTDTTLANTAI